ncbi:hypothetical protein ACFZCL_04295 [Streptomyces sp. NPDC008159]|uniref:hypothetical protein n=1 Tax=Streptomyces sp. NPDC008159 TaxID=3364817 RepID=UPI0036E151CC
MTGQPPGEPLADVDEFEDRAADLVHPGPSLQASAPPRVDDSGGGDACPYHSTAPVIGGVCGGCTQCPSDMTQEG